MMIADDEIVYKRIPFAKGNGQKCCNCNKSSLTSKKCLIYVYKSFPVLIWFTYTVLEKRFPEPVCTTISFAAL